MTEILASLVLILWALSAAFCACLWAWSREEPPSPAEIRYGIAAEPVHMNASGYLLEFRFHVLDPERASEWLRTPGHACLMEEECGTVLPSLGAPMLQALGGTGGQLTWGDIRSILFADPERAMSPSKRATFILGDARIDNLEIVRADQDSSIPCSERPLAPASPARNIART